MFLLGRASTISKVIMRIFGALVIFLAFSFFTAACYAAYQAPKWSGKSRTDHDEHALCRCRCPDDTCTKPSSKAKAACVFQAAPLGGWDASYPHASRKSDFQQPVESIGEVFLSKHLAPSRPNIQTAVERAPGLRSYASGLRPRRHGGTTWTRRVPTNHGLEQSNASECRRLLAKDTGENAVK